MPRRPNEYQVEVAATVWKTYLVTALDADTAAEKAEECMRQDLKHSHLIDAVGGGYEINDSDCINLGLAERPESGE